MYSKVLCLCYFCCVKDTNRCNMNTNNMKNLAFLTHLSGFGGFIFPFGSIVIPLIIRETKKEESKLIDQVSKDVVNFNISYMLYTFILKLSIIPFFVGSFFGEFRNLTNYDNMDFYFNYNSNHFFGFVSIASILSVMAIIKAILIIQATIKTNNNETYKYPFTIKFIN